MVIALKKEFEVLSVYIHSYYATSMVFCICNNILLMQNHSINLKFILNCIKPNLCNTINPKISIELGKCQQQWLSSCSATKEDLSQDWGDVSTCRMYLVSEM